MLEELVIRGLGVIDEAVLPLGPGLTVVTGETGAGKTMVVTGLLLLFGGRADAARVRSTAAQASVDGRIVVAASSPVAQRVSEAGGELDEQPDGSEVVLRRVVSAAGRSRAYVGGAPAPVAVLGELADGLVAVHGQSDQLRLARPEAQREVLDRFAGVDTGELSDAYTRWRAAVAALADRTSRAAELRREADLLAHGLAEIDAATPRPGELDELTRLAARLGHADALVLAARQAHDALLGDETDPSAPADVSSLLAVAARAVSPQAGADGDLDALASRLAELGSLAADLGAEFGSYAAGLDADPQRLEQVEGRRALLIGLVRKYCDEPDPTLDGVLRWAEAARARLADLDVSDEALAALRTARDDAERTLVALAVQVSRRREQAAQALADAVTAELAGLAMADARITVELTRRAAGAGPAVDIDGAAVGMTSDGLDEVSLQLQSHPSAPALPLARGASGGELSRVMLALEVVLLTASPASVRVPTLVFDEVDAGVGGRAAAEVGRRLQALAGDRQVLVVTHLAQVAAFADRHVVVDKPSGSADGSVVASDVRVVDGDERIGELARMLSGSDTPAAREHAAELLADSAQRTADTKTRKATARRARDGGSRPDRAAASTR